MKHERIFLNDTDSRVWVDPYIHSDDTVRPAMLVIPGGGYSMVCHEREGEPIALAFYERGYNAFVLNYRVGPTDHYPSQLIDASSAIVYIKDKEEKYHVDPTEVYALGFSAGGHLAGSLAILHGDDEVLETLGIKHGYNRPKACILCYPVVSCFVATHGSSFECLLGRSAFDIAAEERSAVSLEFNVRSDSAPVFIWHTAEDELVPTNGSFALAQEYVRKGLPVMFHLYPYGPHGLALATEKTECGCPEWVQPLAEGWIDTAIAWFKTLK